MENHHFSWENSENSLFLRPFSIAMLNYQRVNVFSDVPFWMDIFSETKSAFIRPFKKRSWLGINGFVWKWGTPQNKEKVNLWSLEGRPMFRRSNLVDKYPTYDYHGEVGSVHLWKMLAFQQFQDVSWVYSSPPGKLTVCYFYTWFTY
jgi:hypothetical protein